MLRDLDAHVEQAEQAFAGTSIEALVRLELDVHVAYYGQHPSYAKLWFGGRVSPRVVGNVRVRNRPLARRSRDALTAVGLIDGATPEVVFDLLVEFGDSALGMAFRDTARADREVIDTAVVALTAFAERWAARSWQLTRQVNQQQWNGERMEEIGPVDYAVLAFPGNQFKGEIAPALVDLVEAGTIRLIDAAFVSKDENGDVFSLETTDLAPDVQEKLDALNIEVQGLFNDRGAPRHRRGARTQLLGGGPCLGERLGPDGRPSDPRCGGILVAFDRIPHDTVQAAREWALQESNV